MQRPAQKQEDLSNQLYIGKITPTSLYSVLRSSQYFLGLHKSVPWGLYSYFRIFLDTYIYKKQQQQNRLIGFELRRKQGMIRNLSMNERNVDSARVGSA